MHYIFKIEKVHYLLQFNATLKDVIDIVLCFINVNPDLGYPIEALLRL
jgi:hypothetical protein